MRKLFFLALCLIFTGCGTVWTVGFMGASLTVQIPYRPVPTVTATVATQPATTKAVNP